MFRILSWIAWSLLRFLLPLCLSLSFTHICKYNAYTNTVPLIAHLTPETSEPWEGQMVDAGWGLVHEHVSVRCCARMSSINRDEQKVCSIYVCVLLHVLSLSLITLIHVLHMLSSMHSCVRRDDISSVRFHPSCFVLGPYQNRWRTVRWGIKPYQSNLRDKQTHCIDNIWNTLEHRSESGNACDTVQPQTVLVICFLVKSTVWPNRKHTTHMRKNTHRHSHHDLMRTNLDKTLQVTHSG